MFRIYTLYEVHYRSSECLTILAVEINFAGQETSLLVSEGGFLSICASHSNTTPLEAEAVVSINISSLASPGKLVRHFECMVMVCKNFSYILVFLLCR